MTVSIPAFDNARVLIAGDVMLDRYWYGSTSRISPEAPVPVVHVQDIEERPGGAANVAVNVAALGAQPILVGITGEDDAAGSLEELLRGHGVGFRLRKISGRSTITKMRVVSRHQQLIRLDFEDGLMVSDQNELGAEFDACLADVGVVILSDYGKGALTDAQAFIGPARAAGIPVLVDPKGRDFSRYRGCTLITPNLTEFEDVVGTCHDLDDLVSRGRHLCGELDVPAILVTRSDQGMTLIRLESDAVHVPAQARDVYDVTGAGDTVVAVLAGALAAGTTLEEAMSLANLAAGIVVGKLGTATATAEELRESAGGGSHATTGVLDEDTLRAAAARGRQNGERLIMTNGCFDILHAGHVSYLGQARNLGDRLIVAVNDDASVQRLKGHGRPVNTLSRRMEVLAALEAVDWVVPFSEDTPERLIQSVGPDVLVKGGDYKPDEVAGGRWVEEQGGRVEILPFEDGCSTTAILDAAAGQAKRETE